LKDFVKHNPEYASMIKQKLEKDPIAILDKITQAGLKAQNEIKHAKANGSMLSVVSRSAAGRSPTSVVIPPMLALESQDEVTKRKMWAE